MEPLSKHRPSKLASSYAHLSLPLYRFPAAKNHGRLPGQYSYAFMCYIHCHPKHFFSSFRRRASTVWASHKSRRFSKLFGRRRLGQKRRLQPNWSCSSGHNNIFHVLYNISLLLELVTILFNKINILINQYKIKALCTYLYKYNVDETVILLLFHVDFPNYSTNQKKRVANLLENHNISLLIIIIMIIIILLDQYEEII